MRAFNLAKGQSLQIGDITVTVIDVGEDEVILRIDCPEGVIAEATENGTSPGISPILPIGAGSR